MISAGDVIVLNFPGAQGVKPRPGIVVSSDAYHKLRPDLIVALCTSNTPAANTSTDYLLADWRHVGLRVPTAYRSYFAMCEAFAPEKK